jgi:N utilization substance protein B
MQALYAYFLNGSSDIIRGENELMRSILKLHDLYIYQLSFLVELFDFARHRIEESHTKYLPSEEDLNPNTRFIDNRLICQLQANKDYQKRADDLSISWKEEEELIRRLYFTVRSSEEYQQYMLSENDSYENDRQYLISLFRQFIASDETLISFYEEKNIYWANDYPIVVIYVEKSLKAIELDWKEKDPLPIIPNEMDPEDKDFATQLYRKTILHDREYEKLIAGKTLNWDPERIAMLDMLLLKMALAEFIEFPFIPVKVSFNEYIEISKEYSTPKSKVFINGILDKLIGDLTQEERIKKSGRGLME